MAKKARLSICEMCWMRQAADEPKAKAMAATAAPAGCQPRSWQNLRIGEPAEREHGENVDVELAEARDPLEIGEDDGRREDQRLRVGDLRHADEAAGIPERRLARVQGIGEKLELRLEQRLGVIGDGDGAAQPGPGEDHPGD